MKTLDTLERAIKRLERKFKPKFVLVEWVQNPDGTYTNSETGEQVKEIPDEPGVVNVIIEIVSNEDER